MKWLNKRTLTILVGVIVALIIILISDFITWPEHKTDKDSEHVKKSSNKFDLISWDFAKCGLPRDL